MIQHRVLQEASFRATTSSMVSERSLPHLRFLSPLDDIIDIIMFNGHFQEAKEIIAHPLMQVAIDYMWKAGMRASLQQVLFTFLLPVLLPFRIPIFFRDSSDANPKLSQPSPSSSPSNQLEEGFPSDETSGGGCHEIDEEEEQEDEDEGEEETAFLDQNHQQQHTPIRKMKPMMHRPPSISEFLQVEL